MLLKLEIESWADDPCPVCESSVVDCWPLSVTGVGPASGSLPLLASVVVIASALLDPLSSAGFLLELVLSVCEDKS